MDASGNYILHFSVRPRNYKTVLACKVQGAWCRSGVNLVDPNPPFPFVNGQAFDAVFEASADRELKVS